jgi:hypothetical protein
VWEVLATCSVFGANIRRDICVIWEISHLHNVLKYHVLVQQQISKYAVKQDSLCGVRAGSEVHPASCSMDRRRLFPGVRRADVLCTKLLKIEPSLKISESVHPVPHTPSQHA